MTTKGSVAEFMFYDKNYLPTHYPLQWQDFPL